MTNPKYEQFINEQVDELKRSGFLSQIRVLDGPNSAVSVVDGKKVLILCSNNYLGLANRPELVQAAKEASDRYGAGIAVGRGVMTMSIILELERRLAEFKGAEAALTYPTGYVANMGGIWPLMTEKDAILSDELNHASIIDGCRLARETARIVYRHNDMSDLEKKLKQSMEARSKGKTMIITDAVFSMDGDICKLPEMIELAEKYDAFIFLDEAHASGVLGKTGRGTVEHFNAYGRVEVQMGTLSKAIGTVGGYIAGSEGLCYYLHRRSRPFYFSTGFPHPAVCGATLKALEIIKKEPELVQRLWDNTRYFKRELESLGFNTGISQTPITPIIVGEPERAQRLSRLLYEEEGIFVQAFSYPVVPKGTDRIRAIVNAHHTREQLDHTLAALERIGKGLHIL
ncbi:MAG: aminotransferase class I/II-fold pyridoxal phosphate-dependent enzyme [Candidatus Bathyarchaeia archaeon]